MAKSKGVLPPKMTTERSYSHFYRRVHSEAFDAVHKALTKIRAIAPIPNLYYPEHEDLFVEAATAHARHLVYLDNLQSDLYAKMMATDEFERNERKKEEKAA